MLVYQRVFHVRNKYIVGIDSPKHSQHFQSNLFEAMISDIWSISGPTATGTSKITFLQHIHRCGFLETTGFKLTKIYNQHRGEIHQINRTSAPNLQEESGRLAVSWKSGLARITWMFNEKKWISQY